MTCSLGPAAWVSKLSAEVRPGRTSLSVIAGSVRSFAKTCQPQVTASSLKYGRATRRGHYPRSLEPTASCCWTLRTEWGRSTERWRAWPISRACWHRTRWWLRAITDRRNSERCMEGCGGPHSASMGTTRCLFTSMNRKPNLADLVTRVGRTVEQEW